VVQVLLHSKRPTWAARPLNSTEAAPVPAPPQGGAGQVPFRRPLGRGAVGGLGLAPSFSLAPPGPDRSQPRARHDFPPRSISRTQIAQTAIRDTRLIEIRGRRHPIRPAWALFLRGVCSGDL
jgi:hypothetical protein